jgi:poly-gamma-glutamate synthesis protein (capsule biosynthesis protein)
MNRRLRQFDHAGDPGFHQMVEQIRAADAALMNLEQSVFRLQDFDGWPAAENGGNYEVGSPETLQDLVGMGFNLFNRANNHSTDYGAAGLLATNRLMDEWGLVHSGTGANLGWASRPGYLETTKGRIALIGMASTHTPMSRAGAAAPEVQGRPGVNALRLSQRNEGSAATMAALRAAARAQGSNVSYDPAAPVRVFGSTVFPGSVDRVLVSLSGEDRDRVHGPHQLRGIEIYRGRPIFYSLGNFIFQNETIDPMPADQRLRYGLSVDELAAAVYDRRFRVDESGNPTTGFPTGSEWYESVVAIADFEGDEVVQLRLYPIELGWKEPRSQRGTPRLAPEALGRRIIEHLAELSRPFGTEIRYENGIGVWRR